VHVHVHAQVLVAVGMRVRLRRRRRRGEPTFLAVVLVLVQDEAVAALAHVGAQRVDALVLAAPVVLAALVLVCGGSHASITGRANRRLG
jgi:hypothetical protein